MDESIDCWMQRGYQERQIAATKAIDNRSWRCCSCERTSATKEFNFNQSINPGALSQASQQANSFSSQFRGSHLATKERKALVDKEAKETTTATVLASCLSLLLQNGRRSGLRVRGGAPSPETARGPR